MATEYKCTVINVNTNLMCRTGPGLSYSIGSKLQNGATFTASETKTDSAGYVWYKDKSSGLWSCGKEPNGNTWLKVSSTSSTTTSTSTPAKTTNYQTVARTNVTTSHFSQSTQDSSDTYSSSDVGAEKLKGVVFDSSLERAYSSEATTINSFGGKTYGLVNSMNFPPNKGTTNNPSYDFTTSVSGMDIPTNKGVIDGEDFINEIRENLNIYSAYSKLQVNNKYHTEFNRFKLDHPDVFMRNTIGYVVFTRPDLNLFEDDGSIRTEISYDPRCQYITMHNPHIAKSLTHSFDNTFGHNFHPFLSNMAQSIEIMDDTVDTLDTGETFTGYKFMYSKHNIKSITAGTLNIKFRETFDLGIVNTFQLWVDYQSNVYRGHFMPKEEYIWYKNIDYMCNVYYFLLDQDGETLLFWSKYFGVFPQNVPKSTFSYDAGSQVQLPEVSVTFGYIYKEDLSPMTLVEFNNDAGVSKLSSIAYEPAYNTQLGHSGKTWTGVPFVSSTWENNGITNSSYGFKLRFKSTTDRRGAYNIGSDASNDANYKVYSPLPQQELSDREIVKKATGFGDSTMQYIDNWNWSTELYRRAADCIRYQMADGMSGTAEEIVQNVTGFMPHTMEYLSNWSWSDELYRKLANAMKNGI